jgi:hypothetical protein
MEGEFGIKKGQDNYQRNYLRLAHPPFTLACRPYAVKQPDGTPVKIGHHSSYTNPSGFQNLKIKS